MKRFVLTLLAVGVSAVASVQASGYGSCNSCCDPCCDPCPSWCCGSFEVGGQWIYLRPSSCDHSFVIKDDRSVTLPTGAATVLAWLPSGKAIGIDPDYESGFRVSVGYVMDCSCYDVRVEYTYHHPCDRTKVYGSATEGLWPTYMHPRYARNVPDGATTVTQAFETPIFSGTVANANFTGEVDAFAHSSVKHDYDTVDLQVGSRSVKSCNLRMRTYAGLHFMNLDMKQNAHYRGVMFGTIANNVGEFDTTVHESKNTWGIGPLFGIDASYDVACGFGIAGHFGAAILAGETDGRHREHDTRTWNTSATTPPINVSEPSAVKHDHRNLLFPYLRASLGVNYRWCCGDCFSLVVEVGYEFNTYINSVGQFRFNDERGTGQANCNSYNLDGIYVSVRAMI